MGIIKKQNSNRQIQMLKTLCIAATLFLSAEAVTIHLRQEDASTAAPTGEAPAMDDEMFAPIGDLEGHVPSLPVLPEGAAQVAIYYLMSTLMLPSSPRARARRFGLNFC